MPPLISIIIPCRSEEKFIGECLDSVVLQDFPKENLEVLIIDGMSEDGTRKIIENWKLKIENLKIQLLDNPKKFTPFGLNIGIKEAKGELIIRMDAHAGYEKDYISKCIKYLKTYNADNVGGVIRTLPAKNTLIAKAIALSLSHPFGAASDFRLGSEKPIWVDTVFGGCYKREVFDKVGLFNEKLIRSQDLEFNLRLKKIGGKILLVPDIVAYYYPQSTLWDFFKHTFEDGVWSTYPLKFTKMPFGLRHYVPLVFVSSLLIFLILTIFFPIFLPIFLFVFFIYILTNLYFSFQILLKEKEFGYLLMMPIVFAIRHIGYGLGSIVGLLKLFT